MHFVLKLHLLKILYTKNQQQTLKVLLLKLNEPYFMNLPYVILTDKIGQSIGLIGIIQLMIIKYLLSCRLYKRIQISLEEAILIFMAGFI